MIKRRRRVKQTESLEVRLARKAEELRKKAHSAPAGFHREALLRRAREVDSAARMSEWLRSSTVQVTAT